MVADVDETSGYRFDVPRFLITTHSHGIPVGIADNERYHVTIAHAVGSVMDMFDPFITFDSKSLDLRDLVTEMVLSANQPYGPRSSLETAIHSFTEIFSDYVFKPFMLPVEPLL